MPETSTTALLHLMNASKCYGSNRAAWNASLRVARGEILVLLGPSGSGKSTILKLIAGLEDLDDGQVWLNGQNIGHLPPEQRGIGMVFQDYALFPHMTALQNVMFALHRQPRPRRPKMALEHLAMLGMADFAQRYPHQLSGGQQQRVAVARTFASAPQLILLDEPFSSIDESMRAHARQEIRAILRQSGLGVVMVTHDCTEALSFADTICVMNQGTIIQTATPQDIYLRPANAFVASFIAPTNLLPAHIHNGHAHCILGTYPMATQNRDTEQAWLSIRPESLSMEAASSTQAGPQGIVESTEFRGDCQFHTVRIGAQTCTVRSAIGPSFQPGDRVQVRPCNPESLVVLARQ